MRIIRNNQHWHTRRYGTGSGSDRAPAEKALSKAPGRYRSRYRTDCCPVYTFENRSNKSLADDLIVLILSRPPQIRPSEWALFLTLQGFSESKEANAQGN